MISLPGVDLIIVVIMLCADVWISDLLLCSSVVLGLDGECIFLHRRLASKNEFPRICTAETTHLRKCNWNASHIRNTCTKKSSQGPGNPPTNRFPSIARSV